MQPTDSCIPFIVFTILFNLVELSTTDQQFSTDEQIADIPNESMQKYVEEKSKGWIQQGDERQPKVDVKLEIAKLNFSHSWEQTWPIKSRKLGSVSAVSFDNNGNVVVFHRGDHIWDGSTFNFNNVYIPRNQGAIAENTIIAFNRKTGEIAYEWGSGIFYMPHGLTIDSDDNVWVTDVALHQVMKFSPKNHTKPEMTLGTAFQPGNSLTKFCKPTAVAVLPNGEFFVSDGYCNARIIKYSRSGEKLISWGHNAFSGVPFDHAPRNFFAIPHALALASDLGLLCVADRENGRVQCFRTTDGTFHSQYHSGIIGDRLFSVAYAPIDGGQLYVVNGPQSQIHDVMGFVVNMQSNKVIAKFGPNDGVFENPHDIIVSPDGNEIYVAQLAPNIVYKFNSKNALVSTANDNGRVKSDPIIKPVILENKTAIIQSPGEVTDNDLQTSRQMLFVVGLFVSFVCITLFAVWIIARRRKLGNLLERKRGFEKLDQEASDEEPSSSTNALLSSAQFA